jgi:hypothetical protein
MEGLKNKLSFQMLLESMVLVQSLKMWDLMSQR